MVSRIIFGIIFIPAGIAIMVYASKIVDNFTGSIGFAERYFGGGGTYTFVRFVGALVAIVSMLFMFGIAGAFYGAIVSGLGGIAGQ
jgi:hypothetical protein